LGLSGWGVSAETLESALARAYRSNPTLGAQRASLRATDENVARARSLGRPIVTATADIGSTYTESRNDFGSTFETTFPSGYGVQINQSLFNGNRTLNATRQAQSQVLGARESLRNTESTVLFNGAQAYMNVLRDTAILHLERNTSR